MEIGSQAGDAERLSGGGSNECRTASRTYQVLIASPGDVERRSCVVIVENVQS